MKNEILDKANYGSFGVCAADISSNVPQVKLPEAVRDELPTLNRTGYMKLELDEYSKEFVSEEASPDDISLEIGPAYGYGTLKALNAGRKIIAADIGSEHLAYIYHQAPADLKTNLYLYHGSFPSEIDLPENSLKSILISRVMHFLRPDEFVLALQKIHKWLVSGGKMYCTVVSPYHVTYKGEVLKLYQERQKAGDKWPGVLEDMWKYAPKHKPFTDKFFHVFDIPQIEQLLPEYGFKIEKISLFDYYNDIDGNDKGHLGFTAIKL